MTRDNRILGMGSSGTVSLYKENTVLKGYVVWLDGRQYSFRDPPDDCILSLEREREAYERLGNHPHILRYLGIVEVEPGVRSLHFELASKGNLRLFIRNNELGAVTDQKRLSWITGLASALEHVHSREVIHCDLSCRNILLTKDDTAKLSDFGGAKLGGKEPSYSEEPWYELPPRERTWEARPYVKREIFAFGCLMYEIMAWEKPFGELTAEQVEKSYAHEEFPDLSGVLGADIIRRCWNEEFETAKDVEIALHTLADLPDSVQNTEEAVSAMQNGMSVAYMILRFWRRCWAGWWSAWETWGKLSRK
ncbi:hypothetical protein FGG08_003952 [Glutinoglossum americanum]|uniref:EKC/KEOPS complex subunit BUD32 n=1 Tax=Glutinoglossum americanum TaxID=1670608 RepID=A0A9P8I648_9PEZI|nr:hypothetical protein FGG08_003952 [Glutinoglossum americanum]